MDPTTTDLVQRSWQRVQPARARLAEAFYERLFELDPRLEDLFVATEMVSQRQKFTAMLGEVLRLSGDPDAFAALLRASGARHRGYGVVAAHYRSVGEALLWALDDATPGGLDPATRSAWAEAYTHLAHVMRSGADGAAAPAPGAAPRPASSPR